MNRQCDDDDILVPCLPSPLIRSISAPEPRNHERQTSKASTELHRLSPRLSRMECQLPSISSPDCPPLNVFPRLEILSSYCKDKIFFDSIFDSVGECRGLNVSDMYKLSNSLSAKSSIIIGSSIIEDLGSHATKPGLNAVIENYRKAYSFVMCETLAQVRLERDFLLSLHTILTCDTQLQASFIGRFRDSDKNGFFSEWLVPATEVPQEVDAFIAAVNDLMLNRADLESYVKAGIVMHHFVKIHPFVDGNGRMCRLLGQWVLRQCGVPFTVTFCSSFDQYRSFVRACESADCRPMVAHVAKCISSVLKKSNNGSSAMGTEEPVSSLSADSCCDHGLDGGSNTMGDIKTRFDGAEIGVLEEEGEEVVEVCPLCYELPATVLLGCCNQHACISCLAKWEHTGGQEHADKCPLCRRPFPERFIEKEQQRRRLPEIIESLSNLLIDDGSLIEILNELQKIVNDDAMAVLFCSPPLTAVHTLVQVLHRRGPLNINVGSKALAILSTLSFAEENKRILGEKRSGLLTILTGLVGGGIAVDSGRWFDHRLVGAALDALDNLSYSQDNRAYMGAEELGLVEALLELVRGCVWLDPLDTTEEKVGGRKLATEDLDREEINGVETVAAAVTDTVGRISGTVSAGSTNPHNYRLEAMKVLAALSQGSYNKQRMGSVELGLIEVFASLAREETGQVKSAAIQILFNLSLADINKARVGAPQLGLVPVLIKTVQTTAGKNRIDALDTIENICLADECMEELGSPDVGLIQLLISLARDDNGKAGAKALAILRDLSLSDTNKSRMGDLSQGLVSLLMTVVREKSGKPQIEALEMIKNLAGADSNKVCMGSAELKLVELLTQVAMIDRSESRVEAVEILHLLFMAQCNALRVSEADDLGLVDLVFSVLKEGPSEAGFHAIHIIHSLSHTQAIQQRRVSVSTLGYRLESVLTGVVEVDGLSDTGILAAEVIELLRQPRDDPLEGDAADELCLIIATAKKISMAFHEGGEVIDWDCQCDWRLLQRLAVKDRNKTVMGSYELAIMKHLIDTVKAGAGAGTVGEDNLCCALDILKRLSSMDTNMAAMGSAGYGLVHLLQQLLARDDGNIIRQHAAETISHISSWRAHMSYMGSVETGVVEILLRAALDPVSATRIAALQTLTNLATLDINKYTMGPARRPSLVSNLLAISKRYTGPEMVLALETLRNLAYADENMVPMGRLELGLVDHLMDIISTKKGRAQVWALRIMFYLSYATENKAALGSPDLGLVTILMAVARTQLGRALTWVVKTLNKLAFADCNKPYMGSQALGLVELLITIMSTSNNRVSLEAVDTLRRLSHCDQNRVRIARPELGLIDALMHVIRSGTEEARVNALGTLQHIAYDDDNMVTLAAKGLGLIELLLQVVDSDTGESRLEALSVLWNLAYCDENKQRMGSRQLGLVATSIRIIHSHDFDARILALNVLRSLSYATSNQIELASPELGVLDALIDIIEGGDVEARSLAVTTVYNMTLADEGKALGQAMERLIEVLLPLIRQNSDLNIRMVSMETLWNLSYLEANKDRMGSVDLGVVEMLIGLARNESADAQTLALEILGNLADGDSNCPRMGLSSVGLIETLVHFLRVGPNSSKIAILRCLVNLVKLESNNVRLSSSEYDVVPLLLNVLREGSAEARIRTLTLLRLLATNQSNLDNMASPTAGVAEALMNHMRSLVADDGSRELCMAVFAALSCSRSHRDYLSSLGLGLLPLSEYWASSRALDYSDLQESAARVLENLIEE